MAAWQDFNVCYYYIRDNGNENTAEYLYEITLYTRGLDEDFLRKILNSMK